MKKSNQEDKKEESQSRVGRIRTAVTGTKQAVNTIRTFYAEKTAEAEVSDFSAEKLIEHAVANHYFRFEHIGLTTIPEDIFESKELRTELEVLYLQNNKIASISPNISQLQNLKCLDLSHNLISQLPVELYSLEHLVGLNLSSNKISHVSDKLFKMSNLQVLILNKNNLPTLSHKIEMLFELTHLDIGSNNIKSLPDTICNLTNLKLLDVRDNYLKQLPHQIYKLENLKGLYLQRNKIKKLPHVDPEDPESDISITRLVKLEDLDLSYNKLTNESLKGFGKLVKLKKIQLGRNCIDSIPEDCSISDLMVLIDRVDLSRNCLSIFPCVLTLLCETLVHLDLRNNDLVSLSNQIKFMINLKTLNVCHNSLTFLPQELSYCISLVKLEASHNLIRTMHPMCFSPNMTFLKEIILDHNKILSIPDSITELPELMQIKVSHNRLKALPLEIHRIPFLYSIYASHNAISSLPNNIGDCPRLRKLYLDYNSLSSVPESLTQVSTLQFLNLNYNLIPLPTKLEKTEVTQQEEIIEMEENIEQPVVRTMNDMLNLPHNEHVVCKLQ
ncbi:leucine-rich repeat protein SHOC [Acrasis kona]|uniref:Leucine-rich repeat protein SHOC n=1 Tax=Acrasis kona TaxID=1008807 RepID=A0AAW2YVR3_9EUKA